jgi:hypothetical protein
MTTVSHPQTRLRLVTDESPDEAASTRFFLARRINPNAMPELARLDCLGATEYTPYDEYTGPGGSAA